MVIELTNHRIYFVHTDIYDKNAQQSYHYREQNARKLYSECHEREKKQQKCKKKRRLIGIFCFIWNGTLSWGGGSIIFKRIYYFRQTIPTKNPFTRLAIK